MDHHFSAFNDIPDIQLNATGHLQDGYRWSDGDVPWTGVRHNQRAITFFGSELALDSTPAYAMSNMQRYLSGHERPLFETNTFQLGNTTDREHHHFDLEPCFEAQQPLPYTGRGIRQRSPDNFRSSWSVSSGGSSYNVSHKDDLSINSFGSPDRGSSPAYGIQDTTYSEFKTYPLYSMDEATLGAGGSCTLSDIQPYPSPCEETEALVEYDECHDMKMGFACEQETILFNGKMTTDDHHCTRLSDEDAIRVRDAESVKPVVKSEDEADSDWKPRNKQRRRRTSRSSISSQGTTRRSSNASKTSYSAGSGRGRVAKCSKSRNSKSNSSKNNNPVNRPFPCPFAGYSCTSTFASKNEWKRHVSTQHIRLGFWRCQLCPSTLDGGATTSYNDFNRKDLFAQHLRRMHMAPSSTAPGSRGGSCPSPPSKDAPVTEDNMADFQMQCYLKLRDAPPCSSCLFCNRSFEGPGSWEERMEHVGRHFEKEGDGGDASVYGVERWREDLVLEQWLREEGLIELDARGTWQLGNGAPKRGGQHANAMRRMIEDNSEESSEDD
ncbi:c2h2 finger domain-containing protein [Diplodia corticola]|uniref:C2h2 finger domain-containing protein n=1 Tax=Diplodia corticola TaxID=236234 RepID=A0A1J9QK78_9PEZI|nr:c2h2 finger domain-containing protein [Diplodia corticola]OJD29270.1 c2h2 finger domain-containing protein [Diplodia corticola]